MYTRNGIKAKIQKISIIVIVYTVFIVISFLFNQQIKSFFDAAIISPIFGDGHEEGLPLISSILLIIFTFILPGIPLWFIHYYLNLKNVSKMTVVHLRTPEVIVGFEYYINFRGHPKTSLLPDLWAKGIVYKLASTLYFMISILLFADRNYFFACMLMSLPFIIYQAKGLLYRERRKVDLKLKIIFLCCFCGIFFISLYNTSIVVKNKTFRSVYASRMVCHIPDLFRKFNMNVDEEYFYRIASILDIQNTEAYIRKGIYFEKLKFFKKSEDAFLKALSYDTESFEAFYRLGLLYLAMDNKEQALPMFEKAQTANRKYAPAFYQAAYLMYEKGRLDEAEKLLTKAISLGKPDDKYFHLKGKILFTKGKFQDAIASFTQSIELDDKNHKQFFSKSQALFKINSYDSALFNIEKAIGLSPANPQYLYLKGRILASQNSFEKARECFNEAIKLQGDFIPAKSALALMELKQGKTKYALRVIESTVTNQCKFAEAQFIKALILKETQNYEKAIDALDKAISLDSGSSEYYSLKAGILLDMGSRVNIESNIHTSMKINPFDYYAYFINGCYLLQNNKLSDASKAFSRCIQYNPYFSRAFATKALTEQKLKNEKSADDYLDMALKLAPKDFYNYLVKSNIYSLRNKPEAALLARNKSARLYDLDDES